MLASSSLFDTEVNFIGEFRPLRASTTRGEKKYTPKNGSCVATSQHKILASGWGFDSQLCVEWSMSFGPSGTNG
jgi:hypothetical protein